MAYRNFKRYKNLGRQSMTKEFSYDDFKKVLDLAKQNADSFEFCMKENEKLVAELKEKLKPFDNEYFRGLTNEQIAELAKKSIRVTAYNRELEHKLENIKELLYEAQSKSEELMIGDFKQYFDEEFIDKIFKIIESED